MVWVRWLPDKSGSSQTYNGGFTVKYERVKQTPNHVCLPCLTTRPQHPNIPKVLGSNREETPMTDNQQPARHTSATTADPLRDGIVNTPHATPGAERNVECFGAGCCHGGGATPIGCVAVSGGCNSVAHLEQDLAIRVSRWWDQ